MKFFVFVLGIFALIGCITHASGFGKHVRVGEIFNERCKSGTYLYIKNASWDNGQRRCIGGDKTQIIRELCQGKMSCSFSTNSERIFYRCLGTENDRLKVEMECKECPDIIDDFNDATVDEFDDFGNRRKRAKPRPAYKLVDSSHCNFDYSASRTTVRPRQCPHGAFEAKHVCRYCRTFDDVIEFAKNSENIRDAHGWEQTTGVTSVFVGHNIQYQSTVIESMINACVFIGYEQKFDCSNNNGRWACADQWLVRATHDAGTGHYMSNYDDFYTPM